MRCYFLCNNRIAGVEVLPLGLSDEEAVVRAHTVASKRKGPIDSFEVWDRARFIFRKPLSPETPATVPPQPATGPPSPAAE